MINLLHKKTPFVVIAFIKLLLRGAYQSLLLRAFYLLILFIPQMK